MDIDPVERRVNLRNSHPCVALLEPRGSHPISYEPVLIIPAPTVTPVASSIRTNEPVVRFFE